MTRTPVLDDLTRMLDPQTPAVFPCGSALVYAAVHHPDGQPAVSELRVLTIPPTGAAADENSSSRDARILTSGNFDTNPVVSPDGSTVVFTRTIKGKPTLFSIPAIGGEPVALTSTLLTVGAPAVSPDGRSIAFAALVDDHAADPPLPLVIEGEAAHKVDGLGWVGTARPQLFTVPTSGGEAVRLTNSGSCTDPAWSPDGATLAFAHLDHHTPRLPFTRRVGLVDLAAPRTSVRFPFDQTSAGGPLLWSPDGEWLAAIGETRTPVGINRLVRLDLGSGESSVLTADLDRNVMGGGPGYPGGAPAWGPDGRIWFCVRDGGLTSLRSLDPARASGDIRSHELGEGTVISGLSMTGGTVVMRVSDPALPAEILSLDMATGGTVQLTRHWEEALSDVAFLQAQPVSFTVSDGTVVHGWLLRSPDTRGPAPTLLDIHGGPHNAWTGVADAAHLYQQVLAADGWNVLTLNPRASDGYGEEFFTAAVGAWGDGDEQDFLEPLDALSDQGLVDLQRVAVTGYSYGGFMTCWLSSRHPSRFTAAVPGGLVSDIHLLAASSDLGRYIRDIEVGADNAQRLSPVTYVDAVAAPTLVLHGQEDQRCPLSQAELWHSRLQENGVRSQLVVYPGGSHLFILNGPVTHRRDYNQRVIDWVMEHTPT